MIHVSGFKSKGSPFEELYPPADRRFSVCVPQVWPSWKKAFPASCDIDCWSSYLLFTSPLTVDDSNVPRYRVASRREVNEVECANGTAHDPPLRTKKLRVTMGAEYILRCLTHGDSSTVRQVTSHRVACPKRSFSTWNAGGRGEPEPANRLRAGW